MKKKLYKSLCLFLSILITALVFSGCEKGSTLKHIDDKYRSYYEVFVYSYCDSNADGVGDLNGLTSRLDYIADMGFNGIWLMPVNQSTTYHKYDVVDYYSIDKEYGSMEDFDKLIAEADKRGIKIIMDLVLNHSSSSHEWFESAVYALSSGDTDNKYVDYYNFSTKNEGEGYVEKGDFFYEARFWEGMPDLNLANESLRNDIADIAKFWLDKGVYGFRLDAVKEFYSGNAAKNIEVLKWFNEMVKEISPEAYIVGEDWDTSDGLYEYYSSGIDSFFNFPFAAAEGKIAKTLNISGNSAQKYCESMLAAQENVKRNGENGIEAQFFTNHDTARACGFMKSQPELIKMAWGMSMTQSGTSFLYYGEELGMKGSGRDENKRLPMLWSDTDTTEMTNGPIEQEKVEQKFPPVDVQKEDENSILNYIKRANEFRVQNPELARGEITEIIPFENSEACGISKLWNENEIKVLYNLTKEPSTITVSGKLTDSLSVNVGDKAVQNDSLLTLPPYTIAVVE